MVYSGILYEERNGCSVMTQYDKLINRILSGNADSDIRFDDLCKLLKNIGFDERVRGSHHIFRLSGIKERLNLQKDDGHAKSYQVRQVRNVILKYRLGK